MGGPFPWWAERDGPWPAMGSVNRTWALPLPRAALMFSYSWPHLPSRGHPLLITIIK